MSEEKDKKQNLQDEEKVVNLCEDLRPHEHDQKGYEKLVEEDKK